MSHKVTLRSVFVLAVALGIVLFERHRQLGLGG